MRHLLLNIAILTIAVDNPGDKCIKDRKIRLLERCNMFLTKHSDGLGSHETLDTRY